MTQLVSFALSLAMAPGALSLVDTFCVVCLGLLGTLLSEGCAWFFVYRTHKYRELLEDVNRAQSRLDKQRMTSTKSLKMDQKFKGQEGQLQAKSQRLGFQRMKAQLFSSVIYFLIVPVFNR